MNKSLTFRPITFEDIPSFLERAQSYTYINTSNFCDFFDHDEAEEDLKDIINNLEYNNQFFLVGEYDNEIFGYIHAELPPDTFYISEGFRNHYGLPSTEYKTAFIYTMCSFSRWEHLSEYKITNVGEQLINHLIIIIATLNNNYYTILWNKTLNESRNFYESQGMISSRDKGRILSALQNRSGRTPYEIIGEEEYDEGEKNMFSIIKGFSVRN